MTAMRRLKVYVQPDLMPKLHVVLGTWQETVQIYLNYRATPPHTVPPNLHGLVDRMLTRVLDGEDARAVFKSKKQRKRRDRMHAVSMCAEVLRLIDDRAGEPEAKIAVALEFGVEVRTVERNYKKWTPYLTEGLFAGFLPVYKSNLRHRIERGIIR